MKSNISMLDRYVRLTSGLVLLGCAMGMRRRSVIARTALMGFGAMKVAEGATGWCPLAHLAESLTPKSNGESSTDQQTSSTQTSSMQTSSMQTSSTHSNSHNSASDGKSSDHPAETDGDSSGEGRSRSYKSYNAHRQKSDPSPQHDTQVH